MFPASHQVLVGSSFLSDVFNVPHCFQQRACPGVLPVLPYRLLACGFWSWHCPLRQFLKPGDHSRAMPLDSWSSNSFDSPESRWYYLRCHPGEVLLILDDFEFKSLCQNLIGSSQRSQTGSCRLKPVLRHILVGSNGLGKKKIQNNWERHCLKEKCVRACVRVRGVCVCPYFKTWIFYMVSISDLKMCICLLWAHTPMGS